jgi:hypothetical protein
LDLSGLTPVILQVYWPTRVESKHVTKARLFPPWVEQTLEVKKFKTITDKSELEEVIKWAQIALLNHDEDYRLFVPGTDRRAQGDFQQERESTEAKFSPNVIFIEISGPDLPALSFYDLPGIFRVAPDPKDQYLAKVMHTPQRDYMIFDTALCGKSMWCSARSGRFGLVWFGLVEEASRCRILM